MLLMLFVVLILLSLGSWPTWASQPQLRLQSERRIEVSRNYLCGLANCRPIVNRFKREQKEAKVLPCGAKIVRYAANQCRRKNPRKPLLALVASTCGKASYLPWRPPTVKPSACFVCPGKSRLTSDGLALDHAKCIRDLTFA